MIEKQFQKIIKRLLLCLLFTAYCLLLPASCGRRGDPVLIEPRDERAVESEKIKRDDDRKGEKETPVQRKGDEKKEIQVIPPGPPAGLIGIYTQTSVVLTWDEVKGQKIKYRVYRSSGDGYTLAGETVTPAFTDKDVQPNMKYYYKIGAVGATEGPLSKEIQIITEVH